MSESDVQPGPHFKADFQVSGLTQAQIDALRDFINDEVVKLGGEMSSGFAPCDADGNVAGEAEAEALIAAAVAELTSGREYRQALASGKNGDYNAAVTASHARESAAAAYLAATKA